MDAVGSDQAALLGTSEGGALGAVFAATHPTVRSRWSWPGPGARFAFDGPARAIRCADALRKGLATIGLQIRAGLHTGEVEVMNQDIGGIAVHIGQRVSARAAPDEVLVSRTVVDLVAGSDINFDDRGEHELKGVPGKWRLFAVKG